MSPIQLPLVVVISLYVAFSVAQPVLQPPSAAPREGESAENTDNNNNNNGIPALGALNDDEEIRNLAGILRRNGFNDDEMIEVGDKAAIRYNSKKGFPDFLRFSKILTKK